MKNYCNGKNTKVRSPSGLNFRTCFFFLVHVAYHFQTFFFSNIKMFENDMPHVLKSSSLAMYADDCKCYKTIKIVSGQLLMNYISSVQNVITLE